MAKAGDFDRRLGEKIRRRRREMDMTLVQLGNVLSISDTAYLKKEEGKTTFSVTDLLTLTKQTGLDVPLTWFFTDEILEDEAVCILPKLPTDVVTFAPGAVEIALDAGGKELSRIEITPSDREAINTLNKNLETLLKGFRGKE